MTALLLLVVKVLVGAYLAVKLFVVAIAGLFVGRVIGRWRPKKRTEPRAPARKRRAS